MLKFLKAWGTLAFFACLVLFFWLKLPDTFMTARNVMNIAQQMSMLAVVAFSMTVVMAMGDYDLSVGSMASLAGIVAAVVFRETDSVALGVALALGVGIAGGLINGALVSYVGILPFVATLGTLTVFSGFAFVASGGKTIFGGDIPAAFSNFAKGGLPLWTSGDQAIAIPNLVIAAAVVFALVWFALERLVFGRHLYAMGGNAEAARLAGIRVRLLRLSAFCIAGAGAAAAGLMYASRVASANPTQGAGLMLDGIAAVFLGMTMSEEGEPRVAYTLAGVLVLGVLGNGLTQLNVDSYVREMMIGTIIVIAVAASSISKVRNR